MEWKAKAFTVAAATIATPNGLVFHLHSSRSTDSVGVWYTFLVNNRDSI